MLPNFLIIGAPRAGTTWAAKNLMLHPQIYLPKEKELHFFDQKYDKGIEHYKTNFMDVKGKIAVGEATPDYMYRKEIPALIHQHLPDVKLIAILRNPVDRLYSRYWNSKAKYSANKNLSFEEKIDQKPLFIEEGFYYEHLIRYQNFFPKDRFLILFFEDLKSDPYGFLKKIYNFINVDENFVSPIVEYQINTAKSKKYLAKSQLLWNVQRAMRRFKAYKLATVVENINKNEYPEMNKKTRKWLVEEIYKEHNRKLGELVGRDLSHWNKL
jgi:hypothetical protein